MKNYLSFNNSKLRKDGIHTFGIPAYRSSTGVITCPNAGTCLVGCYAKQGCYVFPVVKEAQEARLKLALSESFVDVIDSEIKRRKVKVLRIHDSGDFFSLDYFNKWMRVIARNPQVKFYAYTKMIKFFKVREKILPNNFHVVYSYGGKQDAFINVSTDRHARVFSSVADLRRSAYVNASNSDRKAANGSFRVGLVYHGSPNREWSA